MATTSARIALACAFVLPLLQPGQAQAKKPKAGSFGDEGYVHIHPVFLTIPADGDGGDENIGELYDPSWEWGFGGGYLFHPAKHFYVSVGGAFQHTVLTPEFDELLDANMIRLLPEVRIGGGVDKVFAYGRLSPGLALHIVEGLTDDDVDAGFNFSVGGGVQGRVWRGLAVGGEIGGDLGFFPDDDDSFLDDDYMIHMVYIRGVIAWYFG